MKKNKLWVMATDAEALQIVFEHPHSHGNADHCLFIGPEGPEGSREVIGELTEYLTSADWRWIYAESDKIRAEQEAEARKRLDAEREAFLRRFENELEKEMMGGRGGEPETENSGGDAENE